MYGCPTTRSVSIAQCTPHLCPCPPRAGTSQSTQRTVTATLDWDGELPCDADVRVGAFDGGLIKIQVRYPISRFVFNSLYGPECVARTTSLWR
jgi:hypothetical protein